MSLTPRERVLTTLRHEEPDRVPIDFGGTDATNITVGPYRRLCEHLGIDPNPIQMMDMMQQCVLINDRVRDAIGADTVQVPFFANQWRQGHAYDGTPVLIPEKFRPVETEDGSQVVVDKHGNHILTMPKGGFYFDFSYHPLHAVTTVAGLDRFMDEIENMDRPEWADLPWEAFGDKVREIREGTDRALIGCFAGHVFQASQTLRGWADFMKDLIKRPVLVEALAERLADGHIRAFDKYVETAGKYVDVIMVNDDLGMQTAPWINPEAYRKHIKPYHAKLYAHIRSKTDAPLLLHSDGSFYSLIPDLIEMGIDALNPVQYNTKDMELERLKREFGKDLSFWGGGVCTQTTLPFGTPEDVAREVRHNMEVLAPGGGFVFATVHNVIEGISVENLLAALRTAANHGAY